MPKETDATPVSPQAEEYADGVVKMEELLKLDLAVQAWLDAESSPLSVASLSDEHRGFLLNAVVAIPVADGEVDTGAIAQVRAINVLVALENIVNMCAGARATAEMIEAGEAEGSN